MDFKHTNLLIENDFPKLVRDNIPQRIRDNDHMEPIFHIAEDEIEFQFYIRKKLIEEATEASQAENKTELTKEISDLLEIIDVLIEANNISDEEVKTMRKIKKSKNGGFNKRYIFEGKK